MSALTDILNAIQTPVAALGLIAPGMADEMPVVIRSLPKKEQAVDYANQITISRADKGERVKWYAFKSAVQPKGTIRVEYLIFVTTIIGNGGDYSGKNLPLYDDWREQIRGLFQGGGTPALAGASTVIDLNIDPDAFLPEEMLNTLYDYMAVGIRVVSIEAANA